MGLALLLAAALAAQEPVPLEEDPFIDPGHQAQASSVTPFAPAFFTQYRPDTALQMLERIPGFSIDGGSGGRGFGEGGNVLIDGERPASKSDSLSDILKRIPASSVARIDLIEGAAAGVDMQGNPQVANVIRKKGGGLKGAVTLSGQATDDGDFGPAVRVEAQRPLGAATIDGSLYVKRRAPNLSADGLRTRRLADGSLLSQSDRETFNFSTQYDGSMAYEGPVGPGRLRASLVAGRSDSDSLNRERPILPTPGPVAHDFSSYSSKSGEAALRYSQPVLFGATFEASLLHQRSQSQSDSAFGASTFSQRKKSAESIGRGVLRLKPLGRWTIDGGAETALNTLDTQSVLRGASGSLANPVIQVEELRTEAFGTARTSLADDLSLETGLRFETSRISTEGGAALEKQLSYLKPRALLTWTPVEGRQVSLRLEREVGQLSFGDFSASVSLSSGSAPVSGNPDLEPERSWVAEARYEQRFGERGSFSLQFFHRRWDAFIDADIFPLGGPLPAAPTKLAPGSYYEAAANVGPGWRNLFSVSSDLPLDDFSFDGGLFAVSLQWVEAEATDPVTGEPRDMVGGMSSFSWDAHLSQDLAAYKWGVDVSGSDGTVSYRPNEFTVRSAEPYWSAWAEVKLPFDMTLRGGVNNITDREETVVRTLYDNPRDRGDIRYVENRPLTDGRYYYASLRRNF